MMTKGTQPRHGSHREGKALEESMFGSVQGMPVAPVPDVLSANLQCGSCGTVWAVYANPRQRFTFRWSKVQKTCPTCGAYRATSVAARYAVIRPELTTDHGAIAQVQPTIDLRCRGCGTVWEVAVDGLDFTYWWPVDRVACPVCGEHKAAFAVRAVEGEAAFTLPEPEPAPATVASSAPDRIWAWCYGTEATGGWGDRSGYARPTRMYPIDANERDTGAEYIRRDLVDAMIAEASRSGSKR